MNDLLIGYDEDGLPIWAMFGAEGEDDADTEDEGNEGGEDDDTEDEDDDAEGEGEKRKQPRSAKATDKKQAASKASTYRPPSQKEWERTQAALKKANEEQRAQRKAALEKARKEGMEDAAKEAREKALEESTATWKPRVVRTEAKADLLAMGCSNPARLIKLIDLDKVTIQEDGELLGLEAQLNELKDEWPELFRTADDTDGKKSSKKEVPPAKKVGAGAGSSKKDEGEGKKQSGAALVAARLLGTSS